MKTLEQLLRTKMASKDKDGAEIEITPSFRIAVQSQSNNGVHIIVHSAECSSDTLDFMVRENVISQLLS